MTAQTTAPPAASDLEIGSWLSTPQTDLLRSLLLVELEAKAVTLASWQEALEGSSPSADSGLDRAIAALRMYAAREAIEDIGGAFERLDVGEYGICHGCGHPISFEHLVAIPQARLCAACPPSATSPADRGAGPCLAPRRGEHTGASPECSPGPQHHPSTHTSEDPRGTSTDR